MLTLLFIFLSLSTLSLFNHHHHHHTSSMLCAGMKVGGWNSVNLSNPSVLEHLTHLALFGIKSIGEERAKAQSTAGNTLETKYSLMNITSAESQIVAGVNYFLTIEMQPEECAMTQSTADPLGCELKREVCDLTIWEQVWLNSTQLTKFDCSTRRVTVNNLGARHRIDNEDKSARHALAYATAELGKFYKHSVYYVALVQNTYKQVVNGIKYTFEFEYAPTSCLVSEENMEEFSGRAESECKVDTKVDSMSCVVSVLDQFWLADEETQPEITTPNSAPSDLTNSDKKYDVVDKPSRYTLILKNCT